MAVKRQKNDQPPKVKELHSEADKREELTLMLKPSGGTLTAGGFFRLWLAGNPFVVGGKPDMDDVKQLLSECNTDDLTEAVSVLNASLRALECIEEAGKKELPYKGFCPEWLADLVSTANKSCPMGWEEATEQISLCALTHLVLATCRANGVRTGRPKDYSELDRWILRQNGIKPPRKRKKDHG